jgi:hypothetical protein
MDETSAMRLYMYLVKGWPQPATDLSRHLFARYPLMGVFDSAGDFDRRYAELVAEAIGRISSRAS